ncbi:DUF3052 domain-containing protein [Engelhardtia mirabilis]|uniref:DUF3052 domain-containing protein n=1 Tax=Engelhardtia mirabilis TaxID=2528011 RepID=A0A518BS84_9BACT|nr:hypothetical protein Pla133_49530 [Planctomycetes bacterium Pla133]QDV04157.1 hypothetical protein Pla86_49510 [Planctomycetes bacterium Pla86]
MAGYSGTPLAKKLGIKPGHRVALIDAPEGFGGELEPLPEGVVLRRDLRGARDVLVSFAPDRRRLERRLPALRRALDEAGGLWVAWPKKSSGVVTDLDFDAVQSRGLALGLVDNKVCAIDETWSALRFVVRVADRGK